MEHTWEQGCIAEEFVYNAAPVPVKEEQEEIELDKEYEDGKEVTEEVELSLFESAQLKALDAFIEADQLVVSEDGSVSICAVNEKVDEAKKEAVKQVKQAVMAAFKEKKSKLKIESWNVFGQLAFLNGKSNSIAVTLNTKGKTLLTALAAGAAGSAIGFIVPGTDLFKQLLGSVVGLGISVGTSVSIKKNAVNFIKENRSTIQKNLDEMVKDYKVKFMMPNQKELLSSSILVFTFTKK